MFQVDKENGRNILNDERRAKLDYQLVRGTFTPWQYLEAISNTIGKMKDYFEDETDIEISEESKFESSSENTMKQKYLCCLSKS